MLFVPVVDKDQNPLMPTSPGRARRWTEKGKATGFWKKGVFCVRLNIEPSGRQTQPIAVGVDPGSKKEGFTVKSEAHTFLNIQTDAVTHVKEAMEDRKMSKSSRRQRKTPYRKNRMNRKRGGLPPSTRARWQWKLRILNWLKRLYPVTDVIVEDVKASTKPGNRCWNKSFSPLQAGKAWFYEEVRKLSRLTLIHGYETKKLRDRHSLEKTDRKMDEVFEAHCVDSWVMANSVVGGHEKPDNIRMLGITPLKLHRRELHRRQPSKGGIRLRFGGTRSLGFKRGSIVKHSKRGVCYVGGSTGDRISLHSLESGKRLCQNAKPKDVKFLTYSTWRTRLLPTPEGGGFCRGGN